MLCKIGNEVTMTQSGEIMDCARQRDPGEPSIPYALYQKVSRHGLQFIDPKKQDCSSHNNIVLCIEKHAILLGKCCQKRPEISRAAKIGR